MSYRSNRFNNGLWSLEMKLEGIDPAKASFLSDQGLGVERMEDALDEGVGKIGRTYFPTAA